MTHALSLSFVALFATTSVSMAEVQKVDLMSMTLTPTPLEGVSSAFVSGSFSEAGTFGANAIMEEGSIFPPHAHPDARMSVVLEGTMYLGVGDRVDPSAEQVFEAGSVAITPAGVPHWMAARNGDVKILEIGTGPTITDWVE